MIKLSDFVMDFVAGLGVRHVFMVPGGGAMHLNDSLGRSRDLQFVCNLHEQASAIAAEAYARVSENLGVALVTTGPGGTNTITGVAGAWLDSTPCLFISGQVKRSDLAQRYGVRQLGVQEIDIVSIVRHITKYAVTIMDAASIRYHLEKGIYLARSGRPGPVWIDIPLDVQAQMIDSEHLPGFDADAEGLARSSVGTADQVVAAASSLQRARRPVILAGNGIRLAGVQHDFLHMIESLGIPVLTTRLGVDLLPSSHPLNMGLPGAIASRASNFTLQNCDWLLILGARLDMALIAYAPDRLARAAMKIMVNIDGAEISKMGSSIDLPLCADVAWFIREFAARAASVGSDWTDWVVRCRQWQDRYPFVLPEHRASHGPVSAYAFADALAEELTPDDIVLPGNAGVASEIFLTAFRVKAGQRVFHNKGTGAMGFSQPAAIGACLAGGSRRTVSVDGDGGFQMNIQELETIKRLGLPVKFFVMNNAGYASIRASQTAYFGRLTGADDSSGLSLPDVTAIATAFGLTATRISEAQDLRGQIRHVLALPGPVVCDVHMIRDEQRIPRVTSVQRPDGSMVSKPLEDMWPLLERDEFFANMIVSPLGD